MSTLENRAETPTPADPSPAEIALVAQFDAFVGSIGGYGLACSKPPHELAPSAAFADALTAMRRRLVGTEKALEFLTGGPLTPPVSVVDLDDLCRAVAAMQGHHRAIAHLLRQVLSRDAQVRVDAERYRALRRGATLGLGEDGDLFLGVTIAAADEESTDVTERPCTERNAPFLTEDERSDLNGDRAESKGYVRGDHAIDRTADFVVAELAREAEAATRREIPDADGGL